MLRAVRRHPGDRGGALRHRGAHPHAGALRDAAQGRRRTPPTTAFFRRFNHWFDRTTGALRRRGGSACCGRPRTWLAAFAVMLALAFVLYRRVPSAFIPTEDKGFFVVAIQLPDGASRQRTDEVVEQVEGMLRKETGVRTFAALVGLNLLAQANQSNGATMFVLLKPWDERGKDRPARRDPWPGQRPAVRAQGRARVRLQLPGDPRPRHDRGTRAQPPGPERAGHRDLRPPGAGGAGRHRQAPGDARPRRPPSGPTCRRCS